MHTIFLLKHPVLTLNTYSNQTCCLYYKLYCCFQFMYVRIAGGSCRLYNVQDDKTCKNISNCANITCILTCLGCSDWYLYKMDCKLRDISGTVEAMRKLIQLPLHPANLSQHLCVYSFCFSKLHKWRMSWHALRHF